MDMPRPHNCAEELQRETAIYLFILLIFPDTAFDTWIPNQVQHELAVAFEPWLAADFSRLRISVKFTVTISQM